MSDFRFMIDLPVSARWRDIEPLRAAVQGCLAAALPDADGRYALAMVTGELLENALRHGDWRADGGMCRLRVWGDAAHAFVEVENPVAQGDPGPGRVEAAVARLRGYDSRAEAYQAALVAAAAARAEEGGGLGLARVFYEGGCELGWARERDTLRVRATMPLARAEEAP